MKQEDKELLLKDLCARLPYGVKVHIQKLDDNKVIDNEDFGYMWLGMVLFDNPYHEIKPYLRPMSSMTEEERNSVENWNWNIGIRDNKNALSYFDWLNKKGFDYRGLIPMGLALEAPEDMYKN